MSYFDDNEEYFIFSTRNRYWTDAYLDPSNIEKRKRKESMANTRTTVFASGKIYWAKIVGEKALVANYDGDAREWAYEFAPDDVSFLKENGLMDRLKDKEDTKNPDKGDYIILRKPEFTRDGDKNEPIRIYDENDEPWDNRLIGNGSDVDIKLSIVDYGKGKKKGIYTTAIRVTGLVPYESNEFGGMEAKAGKPTKAAPAKRSKQEVATELLDSLDDDLPFDKD